MNRRLRRNTRKPRIYYDTGWRVQVGKKNFTFHSYESARKYALLHFQHGNKSNWQAYCHVKRTFLGSLLLNAGDRIKKASRTSHGTGLQPLGPPTATIEFLKIIHPYK